MKTNLDRTITNEYEAVQLLAELWRNGEAFHPEDDAHDIVWNGVKVPPTEAECDQLNRLMEEIYTNTDVDPCEILLDLDEQK
jgi:hypothetical protein